MDKKVFCRRCLNLTLYVKDHTNQCMYHENVKTPGYDWYGEHVIYKNHPSEINKDNNCQWFAGGLGEIFETNEK